MTQTFLSALLVVAGVYLCFGATLFVNQSRFIYYPDPGLVATPREVGLEYQTISFTTEDGVKLSAWLIPARNAKGVILFCHGNGGNISHCLETIAIFHRLGYSTFIFDYRGYGESEGTPSETGTYLDVQGAWNYLVKQENIQPARIILHGRSLGGAIAAWLCSREKPRACIIESAFTSAPDMASAMYPAFPGRLLCRFRYDTEAAVKKIRSPLLIVHSPDDEIVPFSHGHRLFAAATEPKSFLRISGTHNAGFLQSGREYETGLEDFLNNNPSQ
ncbi:MAG: alpha/beta hydrolase [Deltaproteobacteria bacterium]|nr:alpha/beta hydrolase [Deltaproteobacteria bacterium]